MTRQAMNPVDAAWYQMDGPVNHAVITGILQTRKPLDFASVRALYADRLPGYERFRQRVVRGALPLARPHWEDMPGFDIGQHLHHIALPEPRDRAALAALIDDIASTPLDPGQPLWRVYVVDGVGRGSALIMQVHHCIGDGTAMMAVMQQLFDSAAGAAAPARPGSAARAADAPAAPAAARAGAGAGSLTGAFAAIEQTARRVVADPAQALRAAGLVLKGAGVLLGELVKSPDPQSPFKGEFGLRKRVAWSEPVAIRDVKAIGAPSGAKVNDVLVAAMAGALRSYLKGRGVAVEHTTLRAMVPVDLRPPQRYGQLGNEFGLVILDLPIGKRSWAQRLAATKAHMDALKRSPEAIAMLALFHIFGRTPKPVEDLANQIFGSKASVVLTNVAGPRSRLYLTGVPIEHLAFWVPHPGRQLGLGISIMSYNGSATLSVIADAHLVPDPERITETFNREFVRMLKKVDSREVKPARKPASTSPRR